MPRESRIFHRWLRIALLVGVPILALACWIAAQPDDRMMGPGTLLDAPSLIYDPFDLSAMAQRGLNAELGRSAGAPGMPKYVLDEFFSRSIEVQRPLKPRYFLEYPHALLLLFRVGYWIQP